MNIYQITKRINERAINENFMIGTLPELRKRYLGKKTLPNKIFTSQTTFENYVFHHGGRDEIQFNIGREIINERICTRYGLCFSLEASRSLRDPVQDLTPFKNKFNQCIESHRELFKGFEMWYYRNGKRHGNYNPQKLSDVWFQEGTFICLGRNIGKALEDLNDNDIYDMLSGFDQLLPIYQFCVLGISSIVLKENRIAKLCWNDSDWMTPSGPYGKSVDPKSHERLRGFGHEEWLFDLEKLINEYHYALLQPVQNGRLTFLNKLFNVRLYAHNSDTKKNQWIGSIKELEVISKDQADEAFEIYKSKGWLDQMTSAIKSVNGDYKFFQSLAPHERFNVRFKPENAKLEKPFQAVKDFGLIIGTFHYQFVRDKFKLQKPPEETTKRDFKFRPGKAKKSLSGRTSSHQKKIIQSELIHDKIQLILYELLVAQYGENNVGMEVDTGLTTRIDVSLNTKKGIVLYEVKSYPSVMMTIRAAFGQLLEYAYYPNPIANLKELIIVSHIPIGPTDKEYLDQIRSTMVLKVFYQSVDLNAKTISKKE